MASIRFLGAAGTVTGSRFLVEAAGRRVLVEAGLFQGMKELRLRNWEPFPVPPGSIDAVVLTHAHIDHSGALPLLVRNGFRREAYCTPATADLARIMLPDSAKLQEEEARYANAKGYSRHAPHALPLYEAADAEAALERLRTLRYGRPREILPGFTLRYSRAGHILGSASAMLTVAGAAGDPIPRCHGDAQRHSYSHARDAEPFNTDSCFFTDQRRCADHGHRHVDAWPDIVRHRNTKPDCLCDTLTGAVGHPNRRALG